MAPFSRLSLLELRNVVLEIRNGNVWRLRTAVGYLPESAPLSPELTVREHMRFRAALRGLTGRSARVAIADAMDRTDVARFADRCAGTLSKGMQQRAGLAQTLLGDAWRK